MKGPNSASKETPFPPSQIILTVVYRWVLGYMEMLYLLAGVFLSFLLGSMNLTTSSLVPHILESWSHLKDHGSTLIPALSEAHWHWNWFVQGIHVCAIGWWERVRFGSRQTRYREDPNRKETEVVAKGRDQRKPWRVVASWSRCCP